MSKDNYVVCSDIHLHNWSSFSKTNDKRENSRLRIILDELARAGQHALDRNVNLYITGDLFHVRGKIPPSVLNPTLDLFKRLIDKGLGIRIIPGNHDLESDDSFGLTNATQSLANLGCEVCNEPKLFIDDKVLMMPWYPSVSDLEAAIAYQSTTIGDTSDWTLMIHAPLNNVIYGIPDHGLDPKQCLGWGFHRVLVGHYHNHKVFEDGAVVSVGATTHQTWGDVGSKAGYLDIRDDDLHHIPSEAPRFVDLEDQAEDDDELRELCEGNYVRVKLDDVSESDAMLFRDALSAEYGALGVVINATVKSRVVTRTNSTVSTGASMRQSVGEWIEQAEMKVDDKALMAECESIASEAGVVL